LGAARRLAPCFLVLDNIEIILGASSAVSETNGSSSSNLKSSGSCQRTSSRTAHAALDRVLSTLLVEMDGIQKHLHPVKTPKEDTSTISGSVIVIATTSNGMLIDRALKRPGRLEEHVTLSSPDAHQV
jgi:SpoVK/Ycf46/Vps4 family AAA+-type ATPase